MPGEDTARQKERALVTIKNPKAVDIILDIKKTFRGKFAANAILYYTRSPEGIRMYDALKRDPERNPKGGKNTGGDAP